MEIFKQARWDMDDEIWQEDRERSNLKSWNIWLKKHRDFFKSSGKTIKKEMRWASITESFVFQSSKPVRCYVCEIHDII